MGLETMLDLSQFGLLLAAVGTWFGVQFVITLWANRYRVKLLDGIQFIRTNNTLSQREADVVDHLESTAFAVRSAILLSLSYALVIFSPRQSIIKIRNESEDAAPNLWNDKRLDDLINWYFISIFAANPLFGIVCWLLRFVYEIRVIYVTKSGRDYAHFSAIPAINAAQFG